MELSHEPQEPALREEIAEAIRNPVNFPTMGNTLDGRCDIQWRADAVLDLLHQRGHVLPGCPPAAAIFRDAKSFAERLTLATLALRILNMLAWSEVKTPESTSARRWLDDYLEGRNHGPVGQAMLWPKHLPGLSSMLRDWGFEPTPGKIPYVARALPNPTQQ